MTIKDSLARLEAGNARFVKDHLDGKLQDSSRRDAILHKQNPYAIILGCADSRVVPEIAFDTGLGELFTIRVAGNIANSSSIASIEYAVLHCGSKLIVVLSHQSCGAVTAAHAGGDNGLHLNQLLAHIAPALETAHQSESINDIAKRNAILTKQALTTKSTIIKKAVDTGEVKIIAAYYHLDTGQVDFLDK